MDRKVLRGTSRHRLNLEGLLLEEGRSLLANVGDLGPELLDRRPRRRLFCGKDPVP
jgi:hypothetical protein